jgi:hypothetical protein
LPVSRAAEALHESNRGRLGVGDAAASSELGAKAVPQLLRDGRQHVGSPGTQRAQVPRQAQHPLAIRDVGQDAIGKLGAELVHPAHSTARTDAALLTGEAHEQVVAAPVAV